MERAESKDFEGVASEAGRFLYEILFEWLMGREPLSVRLLLQIGWFKLSIEEWCAFLKKKISCLGSSCSLFTSCIPRWAPFLEHLLSALFVCCILFCVLIVNNGL